MKNLLRSLRERTAHPAVVWGGRSYSFEEMLRWAGQYVAFLERTGVKRGDRVAIFAETCPELIAALVGHLSSGIIHVPINTRYKTDEARHILEDSGAVAVLAGDPGSECKPVLDEILRERRPPQLREVISLAEAFPSSPSKKSPSSSSPKQILSSEPPSDNDVAMLIYTSGTTGKSKGVALSHRALEENTRAVMDLWRFTERDRLVLALPSSTCTGSASASRARSLRASRSSSKSVSTRPAWSRPSRTRGQRPSWACPPCTSACWSIWMRTPKAPRLSGRHGSSRPAARPFRRPTSIAFQEKTGHAILERYGMSETLFTLSNPYEGERRPGTVGLPVPGCSVRLVDDEGREPPVGELGEIHVKGNGLMSGYWGREADTAAAFRDGWFLTGDVARRDADGYVTIVGRKSVDMIKSGGFKISAREIEDVLRRHPAVKDAAVVGLPDRVWGQRIAAAVVLNHGATRCGCREESVCAEVAAFAAEHLADFKKPRDLRAVPELPRNALGKVQKHLLVRDFSDRPGASVLPRRE